MMTKIGVFVLGMAAGIQMIGNAHALPVHKNSHHNGHSRHMTETVAIARPVIHSHDTEFRSVRNWCRRNPGLCIRVGNTYIVQGR